MDKILVGLCFVIIIYLYYLAFDMNKNCDQIKDEHKQIMYTSIISILMIFITFFI